jgi:hypothetical protein
VGLDKILYGGDDIEDDTIESCSFNHFKMAVYKFLKWAQLLNRLVDLDIILYEDDDIEDDLDSILISSVASTIPKWWTFKLLWWVQLLN